MVEHPEFIKNVEHFLFDNILPLLISNRDNALHVKLDHLIERTTKNVVVSNHDKSFTVSFRGKKKYVVYLNDFLDPGSNLQRSWNRFHKTSHLSLTLNHHITKTSRDRPKSAPYLRLKNSKRTSKCQVFSSTVPA